MKNPSFKSSTRLLIVAFLFLLVLIAVVALPVHAAPRSTVTVTNTNDSGAGSLRAAIATAASGDTIVFSLTLPTTITLSSQLVINKSLTISGPGAPLLAISGNHATQVMSITSGITLYLFGLTISDGYMFSGSGAIDNSGSLNIDNSTLARNHAIFGSAAIGNSGVLTVDNTTFSDNSGAYGNGAIGNIGKLTINNSTFSRNGSARSAGGISNSGALVVNTSNFSGNNTGLGGGGGIMNYGSLILTNSTFSGNISSGGGAVGNFGTATVVNSTFYSNTAYYEGGGILNYGMITVTNSTFSASRAQSGGDIFNNTNRAMTLLNSILANSSSGGNCFGAIVNGGNNIDDGASCGWGSANGSMSNTNPRLGPLANNGGATLTMALLPGSPAIDGVIYNAPNGCPSTDQRGVARPQGLRCDIGTYELQQPTPTPVKPSEVPEAATLLLTGSGISGLTIWLGWQRRKLLVQKK